MVLGIRSKSRKNVSVQVEFLIHIEEIKPWPLSKKSSHQTVVFLQWDNGDQPSGSITSQISDGKIEFSESFRIPVTLVKEAPPKKKNISSSSSSNDRQESYQKNSLEFFLYEPRKDKPAKGQLLGQVAINLTEYYHGDAVSREPVSVAAPVSSKKSLKEKPVLFMSIQAFRSGDGIDSVSEATGEEGEVREEEDEEEEEEYEIAAFTDDEIDDDVHSVLRTSPVIQFVPETSKSRVESVFSEPIIASALRNELGNIKTSPLPKSSTLFRESPPPSRSIGGSFNQRSQVHERAANPFVLPQKSTQLLKKSMTHNARSSSHSPSRQENPPIKPITGKRLVESVAHIPESTRAKPVFSTPSVVKYIHEATSEGFTDFQVIDEVDNKSRVLKPIKHGQEEAKHSESLSPPPEINKSTGRQENGKKESPVKLRDYSFDVEECRLSPDVIIEEDLMHSSIDLVIPRDIVRNIKLKHAKSVQITSSASKSRVPEIPRRFESKEASPKKLSSPDRNGESIDNSQIEKLKEELREAAAVEVGLYSIVAEHGSSANKIHASARRLSRFYFHASKSGDKNSKANAAKAVVSGFILVSKACGNDVPRLTFWLSNAIMLRAIVGQSVGKSRGSGGPSIENRSSNGKFTVEKFDSLDEPQKFMAALENFESWIFSRIVESVWWQTMTPHMQPAAAKASISKRTSGKKSGFSDEDQGYMSIELWKKAFNDAHQRLCPSRASGHECGCLPVLARLVMEQLVSRLDVAMFNAILRENGEEMPTDPVSDPISDSKVLPISAGRSSFGAGVNLKNAIGNWSRCLTDIFDIDDGLDDKDHLNDEEKSESQTKPFKPFRLLNALSDLMMVPFEMLADKSARKEVCPTLSPTLIKMVLYNFVPDEFCPTPIPMEVFEALDAVDDSEGSEESITNFPCDASPTVYSRPSVLSLRMCITGDSGSQTLHRSGSSVLRKSYTSDDELDELDSPIASIIKDNSQEKRKGDRKVVRYQLLREAWKESN